MKNRSTTFKVFLVILDCLALLGAFTAAYILRISLDSRPFHIQIGAIEFFMSILSTLPLWIILFYFFGLYSREVYTHPVREVGRLLLAATVGVMIMISFSFFTNTNLFPAKLVAVYAIIISFAILFILRVSANLMRIWLLSRGVGVRNAIIVGNNEATRNLAEFIYKNPSSGFRLVGINARNEFIPEHLRTYRINSLKSSLSRIPTDVIIQTDQTVNTADNYDIASKNYIEFYQTPTIGGILTAKHTIEILNASPIIKVHSTPLMGYGQVVKRIMDITLGVVGLIIASPIMLIVALAVKISDPDGPILMRGKQQKRLTRHNKPFNVYKFRSHYARFDGKTDEEVFEMVGRPELIKEYREKGDKLDNDFRVTPVGKFIRRFSLDELPQLFNVVKGDISLVGPRALVPHELSQYEKKHTLLAVKSGLTGLAVVSGRRNISFEERRRLDLYYVQNWSLWLDINILLRTILVVFKKED